MKRFVGRPAKRKAYAAAASWTDKWAEQPKAKRAATGRKRPIP